jgi:tetratricopeptide (TPR) repeat protein
MKESPVPALQLAKVFKAKKDAKAERESIERALQIDPGSVDAWAYLTAMTKDSDGEEKAIAKIEELAKAPVNVRSAAPYIALQGFFANEEKTRDRAVGFAKKAVERAPQDALALLCLSALYGQSGKLDEVVKLLAPHEAMMQKDVRLAHNYFEALFQSKDMTRITSLLNKLATSPVREVKQFAIERSRGISQLLAQQQAALAVK